ncbi:telomere length regulation protein [Geranomyces michiganensis]|nr:telomere length regulation protein [Geranomyces michiganensis]
MASRHTLLRLQSPAAALLRLQPSPSCGMSALRPFSARLFSASPAAAGQLKIKSMSAPTANWELTTHHVELKRPEKAISVPAPRGAFKDPKSFLTAIGRSCDAYADKFKDWDHLFKASTREMETDLGVKCGHRKYILSWREWFRRGIDPYEVKIAKRQKRYLKLKAEVKLARLQRQGLA